MWRTDRLQALREQHGYSRRELARLSGLGENLISKYESGISDPNIDSLKLLAGALNVSADYLLGLTDNPRGYLGEGQIDSAEQEMLDTYRREGWAGVARLSVEKATRLP